jgi:D-alanyl-lipoteichoic acid acyltransferase DltB (MBOAT superfamily)
MLLGGLWHGANLNFVVWGGMHGLALGCHKFLRQQILNRDKCYHSLGWRKIIAVILTFHFVCFTWIFFRNTSFDGSYDMIKQIFTNFHGEIIFQIIHSYKSVFVLIIFGYLTHFIPDSIDNRIIAYLSKVNIITYAVLITCVIFIVIQIKSTDIQPFIYFQF